MSGPPTTFLMIDANVFVRLTFDHSKEEIGAAMLLLAFLAGGHEAETDDTKRRVCQVETRVWKRIGPSVLAAVDLLILASEPRKRFGRRPLPCGLRKRIFARDGAVCRYCQTTDGPFHIDHILPVARGGTDREENLCVACAPCNFAKSAKVGAEWNY